MLDNVCNVWQRAINENVKNELALENLLYSVFNSDGGPVEEEFDARVGGLTFRILRTVRVLKKKKNLQMLRLARCLYKYFGVGSLER